MLFHFNIIRGFVRCRTIIKKSIKTYITKSFINRNILCYLRNIEIIISLFAIIIINKYYRITNNYYTLQR